MTQAVHDPGVRELFDANARTYDSVNTIISLGMDGRWRRWVARKAVRGERRAHVLDAFAGTGLVGLEAAALGADVTLADESPGMLDVAMRRADKRGLSVRCVTADLVGPLKPLPGAPFDAATLVFGVRYLDDPAAVIRNLAPMLRPEGTVVLLEFCEPRRGPVPSLAGFYFFRLLPWIAGMLAGDRELYDTLVTTTHAFGGPDRLRAIAEEAGLEVEEVRVMGFGLVVGVVARRA